MQHSTVPVCAVVVAVLLYALASTPSAGQATRPSTRPSGAPTGAPAGSVAGTITAASDVPMTEMVVFLESPDPSRPMPPPPPAVTVSQKNAQFDPPLLVVTAGQAVEFPNDEDRPIEHNVFSNSAAKRFDLGLYPPGESKSVVFDEPGAVYLYCSIHRYMDGVIFVAPTPYTSRVGNDGTYRIEHVPSGEWVVKTWQRRRRFPERTAPVTIEPGQAATVDLELKRRR
jgi:plastocyanin